MAAASGPPRSAGVPQHHTAHTAHTAQSGQATQGGGRGDRPRPPGEVIFVGGNLFAIFWTGAGHNIPGKLFVVGVAAAVDGVLFVLPCILGCDIQR